MVRYTPKNGDEHTKEEQLFKKEIRKMAIIGTIVVILVIITLYILNRIR